MDFLELPLKFIAAVHSLPLLGFMLVLAGAILTSAVVATIRESRSQVIVGTLTGEKRIVTDDQSTNTPTLRYVIARIGSHDVKVVCSEQYHAAAQPGQHVMVRYTKGQYSLDSDHSTPL